MFNKNIAYYKVVVLISEKDLNEFSSWGEIGDDKMGAIFERLYTWMRSHPYLKDYYSEEVINTIKASESALWNDTINVTSLDDAFVARQRFFGQTFAAMGVSYEAYIAAILFFHSCIRDVFEQVNRLNPSFLISLGKMTNLWVSTISDTYTEAANRMLTEQNQALMEMSTPVTQLWDGILLLPLVGFIDSKRAQETMSAMLEMIGKTQAKVFILDISGVAVVDTAVANYFIKITKASKLMGCTCMISGISGSVAQTIVELGIQIEEVTTTGNMKEALNRALGATGAKVVYLEQK